MSHATLVALYVTVGMACGAVVYARAPERNGRAVVSAIAAVALWPLWGPFAVASAAPASMAGPFASRVRIALNEAVEAIEGSDIRAALGRDEVADIVKEVAGAEGRLAELEAELRRGGKDAAVASARALALESSGADAQAIARARLHATGLAQLEAMRDEERRGLEELAELAELLRAHLILARFGGEGRAEVLRETLWERVRALSAS